MGGVPVITRTDGDVVATAAKAQTWSRDREYLLTHFIPFWNYHLCLKSLLQIPCKKTKFSEAGVAKHFRHQGPPSVLCCCKTPYLYQFERPENSKEQLVGCFPSSGCLKKGAAKVIGKDVAAPYREEAQKFQDTHESNLTIQMILPNRTLISPRSKVGVMPPLIAILYRVREKPSAGRNKLVTKRP